VLAVTYRVGILCLIIVLLQACGGLQREPEPAELALPQAQSGHWVELEKVRQDDWYLLLNTGREALDWRLRAIDSAVSSIEMQTFIWKLDEVGRLVRDRLLAAAQRGVRVRVLVDDSFTAAEDAALLEIDSHPAIDVRLFNPYENRSTQTAMRVALNLGDFQRLDHRMHNKVLITDGRAAIVGGRNTAAEYFGYDLADNFRDIEVIAGGAGVGELVDAFDSYWNDPFSIPVEKITAATGTKDTTVLAGSSTGAPVPLYREQEPGQRLDSWREAVAAAHSGTAELFIDTPPQSDPSAQEQLPRQLGAELLAAIGSAKSDIWLVSAYLIPTPELETVIEQALDRGVRVRLLTNSISSNNHLSAHSAYRKHVERLVAMGAEVHELKHDARDRQRYMEAPVDGKYLCLHAKTVLLDDNLVFIGSPNLDARSLRLNTEMGLLIDSPSLNRQLKSLLEPDFDQRNAWQLQMDGEGTLTWVSGDEVLSHQPTHSYMRRLEDWFLSHLPIEGEM
jgi:putative cardiolipin synthase